MYWFPVIMFPRYFPFTKPSCYLFKFVLLCIHSACVALVVCNSMFVFIHLLCSLTPSVLYVWRLFISFFSYSQHLDAHLCLLICPVTSTQHLTTAFTKINSGLRSISTLHQLLMNKLFLLSLSRLFKHVLLCLWKFFIFQTL